MADDASGGNAPFTLPAADDPAGGDPTGGGGIRVDPGDVDPDRWAWTLGYLTLGWKLFVLPRSTDGKVPTANCDPCRDAGVGHDREACACLTCHGFYAATDDLERLAAMWRLMPDGLLGLRTGAPSGVVVIDAEADPDPRQGPGPTGEGLSGVDVVDHWEKWVPRAPMPHTLTARSASGGRHLYLATGSDDVIRSRARVLPGVDIRANGGYAVLPPGARGERSWVVRDGDAAPGGPGSTPGVGWAVTPSEPLLWWLRGARGGRYTTRATPVARPSSGAVRGTESTSVEEPTHQELLRDGVPMGMQQEFLNKMIYRMVKLEGITDRVELTARAWPVVSSWDQDPRRPWIPWDVEKQITHVLGGVEPGVKIPRHLPRLAKDAAAAAATALPVTDTATTAHPVDPPYETAQATPESAKDARVDEFADSGAGTSETDARELDALMSPFERSTDGEVIPVDFGADRRGGSGGGSGASGGGHGEGGDHGGEDGDGDGRVGYLGTLAERTKGAEGPHDLGNANRLARLHGRNIRWLEDEGRWLVWDGVRWARERVRTVEEWANDVAEDIDAYAREALASGEIGEKEAKMWGAHALGTRAISRKNAMLSHLKALPGVTVHADQLDTESMELVVRNGVLDLGTQTLRTARRGDLNSRRADVVYDAGARCPRWLAHMELVSGGDKEMAAYLQRLAGYTLTGLTSEQAFFSLEGTGDNGKNAFIEPLRDLMGDYADTGDSRLVCAGDRTHAAILADLVGKRLIFIDEIPASRAMDVERVKTMTGSTRMKAQHMRENWFFFRPQLKMWIAGNEQPPIRDTSDGIWRRMHRIRFRGKVAPEDKVKGFSEILFQEEASGILNWALQGLADWQALGGLGLTETVRADTQELREEQDHVGMFLEDCCEVTGNIRAPGEREGTWVGDWVSNARLFAVYRTWCETMGIGERQRTNATQLGRRLSGMGAYPYKDYRDGRSQARGLEGVRLTTTGMELGSAAYLDRA